MNRDRVVQRPPPTSHAPLRARALLAMLLMLVAGLPLAAANDIHEAAYGADSFDYIKDAGTSTEHSLGTGFITSSSFAGEKVHHIAVYLQRVGTAENACVTLSLRSAFDGGEIGWKCVNAANVPTTAGWVDFYFDSPVTITPGGTYFFLVKYHGSCDTCIKMFWANSNSYRDAGWPTTKYGQSGTSCCWYVSGTDIAFLLAVDHTSTIVSKPARDVTSSSATIVGGNDDDAGGLATNIYFQWGTTTSYGQTTGSWGCQQGFECWIGISGLAAGTTYHYRACGTNYVGTQCGADVAFTTNSAPNSAPYVPSSPSPANGATGVSTVTFLSWTGGDPNPSDTVTYDVYRDPGTTASTLICSSTATSCPQTGPPAPLSPNTQYAWRVVARDNFGATTNGPTWTFTTTACAGGQVTLWQNAGYGGGCKTLSAHNDSFPHATFSNGANLNDAVSSIQVASGYYAILYADTKFNGVPLVLSASDSDLTDNGFENLASSIRVLPCDPNAKVVLFEHSDYTGGCAAFNADDVDLTNNVFSNGVGLNDQTTSLWIKEGYTATLYADINGAGSTLTLARHDGWLVDEGFNDLATGLRIGGPPSPPANDALDRAALVQGAYVYNARISTSGATTQASETLSCGGTSYGSTVWFQFKARNAGTARVSTWGSDYNTVLAAYAGTGITSPTVGCNNDGGGVTQSRLEFTCVKDQEYRIQVGGVGSAVGNLVFQLSGCLNFHSDPFIATPADPYCVSSGKRFEVLYAHPNDAPDLYNQRVGRIREMVREMNGFLRQDAAMQGGRTADYRVKCTGGVIDVANVFVNIPTTGNLVQALRDHVNDYEQPDVKYIVWFEKRYDCGFGYATGLPGGTDAFGTSNPINGGPHWAVIDCDDSSHGPAVMMHEVGHTMGAVHDNAPDSDGGGHCTDSRSMMCDYDGDPTGKPCTTLRYDCGFDSYFNPNPKPGDWLFDHWNHGHPYNEFVQFTAGPANDNFAARTTIGSAPYSQTVSTSFATHEAGEPWSSACGLQTNSVWYRYTPASSGTVTVATTGSSFDTALAAYTGSALGGLSQVACNDNNGAATTSQISFSATAGTSYAIQAAGRNGAAGSLQVQLTCSPNNCAAGNQAPAAPTVSCSPNPSTPTQTVTCTFSSTDADSTGVYYTVSWGDGSANTRVPAVGTVSPGTSQSAGHAYTTANTYTISVTATDNGSPAMTSAATTRSQTVQLVGNAAPSAPTLSCSPSPSQTGQTVTCTFSSTDVDSTGVYYNVNWGDGATARVPASGTVLPGTSQTATRAYPAAGTFTISVTATDNGAPAATSAATTRSQTVNAAPNGLPYSQTFDSGAASGWTLSGLWHTTTCRSFSTSYSLGYNRAVCPTDFNTGATTTGSAITPPIVIPAGASPRLKWQGWHSTESGTAYDKKTVSVTTNDGASWTQIYQEDGAQSTWNARDLDLSAYAGSTIKVRFLFDSVDSAINTGEGWYVDNVAVEAATATVPGAPQGVAATAGPGVGQIRVTWSAPASNGGSAITGYKVYRATSCTGTFALIATVSATTLSYTDSGLGNGQFRCYKVSATNAVGEGPQSGGASATTWSLPGAPTGLDASPGSSLQQIRLTWSAPASNGGTAITSYKVYRATGATGSYAHVGTTSGTTLTYTDSGLTPAQAYYYYVRAVNAVGEGPQSNTDCAKPYPDPIGGC